MDKYQEARQMAIRTLAQMPPASQLLSPLEFIFADHFRQRTLCSILDKLAASVKWDNELVMVALRFLQQDFSPHVIDEEEDLFPLLRRRSEPEDKIEDVLGQLSEEHASDKVDAEQIIKGFSDIVALPGARTMSDEFRALLGRFAANERRHLIVENAIVMPLARVRLTADDLRNLGRRMAARRGIDYPENGDVI